MRCATPATPAAFAAFAKIVGDPQEARRADCARIVPSPEDWSQQFPVTDLQRAYLADRKDDIALGGVGAHAYAEFELPGVDLRRVETVLSLLIARHGMLRAVFDENGTQVVLTQVPEYRLEYPDLSERSECEAHERVASLRRRLSHRVFRPDTWPLFEVLVTTLPRATGLPPGRRGAGGRRHQHQDPAPRIRHPLSGSHGIAAPARPLLSRLRTDAHGYPPPQERASVLSYWLGQFHAPAYPPQLPMQDAQAARGEAGSPGAGMC